MRLGLRLLGLALSVTAACHGSDSAPHVGFYELDSQRISGLTTVPSAAASGLDVTVRVTVDTRGHVLDAQPLDVFHGIDPKPALAAVRQWVFRPQTFEGRPVIAVGQVSVKYQTPEIPPDLTRAFPNGDPAKIEITLDRGACFGTCPDYSVTVRGDGTVLFTTNDDHFAGTAAKVHLDYNGHNVLLPGTHTAHVDPAAVAQLVSRFRAAHFFGLKDEYAASVTDNPTQRLTVHVGGLSKTVTDYVGDWAGMPHEVRELENAVDEVAGTARWVQGDRSTLTYLDSQHFDFRSSDATKLAAAAVERISRWDPRADTGDLVMGLVDRGVSLRAQVGNASLGDLLVQAAASSGNERLFNWLADKGQLARTPKRLLDKAFVQVGCSPAIATRLVKAGANPRFVGEDGSALTALGGLRQSCGNDERRALAMARTLIDLGVPLEARNSLGWTALMGCDSPDLARLLLSHGANPNAHDNQGTTAVLSTDDDRVALILLRAGANPRARNEEGSLRDQAIKHAMPATLAWLDEHGIR